MRSSPAGVVDPEDVGDIVSIEHEIGEAIENLLAHREGGEPDRDVALIPRVSVRRRHVVFME